MTFYAKCTAALEDGGAGHLAPVLHCVSTVVTAVLLLIATICHLYIVNVSICLTT
jgi:hypothetical protein